MANAGSRIPMPQFTGKEPGTLDRFLRNFEAWAAVANITAPVDRRHTAVAYCFKEGSPAAEWYDAAYNPELNTMDTWVQVQALMQERFNRQRTPGEMSKLLTGLLQQRDESVDEFYTRVRRDMRQTTRGLALPHVDPDNMAQTMESIQNHYGKHYFLQGLKEKLKQQVCSTDALTFDEYLAAARRSEGTAKDLEEAAHVDALYAYQGYGEHVDAYGRGGRGGGRGAYRGRGGYQGRGRGAEGGAGAAGQVAYAPRGRGAPPGARGGAPAGRGRGLPRDMCATCGKMGHWRETCTVPERNWDWGKNGHQKQGNRITEVGQGEAAPQQQDDGQAAAAAEAVGGGAMYMPPFVVPTLSM